MRSKRHLPPDTQYPLQRRELLLRGLVAFLLAGLAVVLAWRWQQPHLQQEASLLWWLATGAWCVLAALALRFVQCLPRGWLLWQDGCWQVAAMPHAKARSTPLLESSCECLVDLQWAMLLRVRTRSAGQDAVHWVWLQRNALPGHWIALRQAVVWAQGKPSIAAGVTP